MKETNGERHACDIDMSFKISCRNPKHFLEKLFDAGICMNYFDSLIKILHEVGPQLILR